MNWRRRFAEVCGNRGLTDQDSQPEFQELLDSYFRWRFGQEQARGARIIERDWCDGDENDLFFGLCHTIALALRDHYEFQPYAIELHGSAQRLLHSPSPAPSHGQPSPAAQTLPDQPSLTGLHIAYDNCAILVQLGCNTSIVTVGYCWPESYSSSNGPGILDSGSSHSDREYPVDLNDPQSIATITDLVFRRCADMPGQWRPSD